MRGSREERKGGNSYSHKTLSWKIIIKRKQQQTVWSTVAILDELMYLRIFNSAWQYDVTSTSQQVHSHSRADVFE